MATTLTEPAAKSDELTYVSFEIAKFDKTPDGDLYVLGKASDDSVDSDEQIVDSKWMQKAVQDWLSTGANVRVQHQAQRDPAGIGVEAYTEKDGSTWVKSLVVEPVAKTLVEKGALRAYSVGIARPKIMRDSVARGGRIVDGELCEISLVDRPANKNCGITLVKSASDGAAEYVDELFGPEEILLELKGAATMSDAQMDGLITKLQGAVGGFIGKTAEPETVSLELPKDVSVSFSPADLAKLLKHRQAAEEREAASLAEKRHMDQNVGNGVDRDKLPDADFAGRNRSFPIVTPADVADAAMSIGRAGEENFSSEKLKENIIAIAHRKGPQFVSELPESWKSEDEAELEKGKKGGKGKKPAFAGAAKPFGAKDGDEDEDDKGSEAKPDATKGEKDCPKCGAAFHSDSKLRRCEKCNAKLPRADKSEGEPDIEKKMKVVCQGCGAMIHDHHNFCPECGSSAAGAPPVVKNHEFQCLGCSEELDRGEKFCGNCGKGNPGYLPMADSKVKAESAFIGKKKKRKKGKPVPGEGVEGAGASNIEPVPSHREPDGVAVEAFEHDAGLPTDPDDAAMKAAARHAAIGAPSDLATLHDHLCGAFDPADVAKCYPADAIASLSVMDWQQKAFDSAASDPVDKAQAMTALWQNAVTLKGADPEVVAELRAEAFKEYKDAHPGPGTFPTPMELNPTRFRRGALTGDHAQLSPGHDGPNTHAVPTDHICADDFSDGYQTAGRAEQSPSNKGMDIISPAPLPPGMGRTYYRNAEREAAKAAMAAMHDHIAQTFPDLCPRSGAGLEGAPAEGARSVPLPVGKSEETTVNEINEADDLTVKAAKVEEPVASTFNPEIVKSAVAEANAGLMEKFEAALLAVSQLNEKLAANEKILRKQQKRLDALAELPDPREAPFKGIALQHTTANKSANGVPVGARTVAENAEQTQMALMTALKSEAMNNPDPAQREAAWNRLYQMTGIRP